jgi:hypothetical protein
MFVFHTFVLETNSIIECGFAETTNGKSEEGFSKTKINLMKNNVVSSKKDY